VKFSSIISIQIFSVKNANLSFYARRVENDYFPLPSKFEMDHYVYMKTQCTSYIFGALEYLKMASLLGKTGGLLNTSKFIYK
jgi:hypothetical protein